MTFFWIATGLMAALAGLVVLVGARRGMDRLSSALTSAAPAHELDELDRLKARGLLDEAGWAAARAEAGRRILSAGRQDAAQAQPLTARPSDRLWVMGGLGLGVAAALGLYVAIGSPGLPDQPYEQRVTQWSGSLDALEPAQIAAVAARVVRERPGDAEALSMLGAARFEAGDPIGAVSAFRRVLALTPDDAQSWARLGESLVMASDGQIGADAQAAFTEALKHDPGQLGARFFLGEAALRRGDVVQTRVFWTPLIEALESGDPRRADLVARLGALQAANGAGES